MIKRGDVWWATLERASLTDHMRALPRAVMKRVDDGLRLILEL